MGGNLFGIGFGELLFLAILALVVFGPKRIPEIARTVGRFMRQVREATSGLDREVRQWMDGIESPETWLREEHPTRRPSVADPPLFSPPGQEEDVPDKVGPSPPSLSG